MTVIERDKTLPVSKKFLELAGKLIQEEGHVHD